MKKTVLFFAIIFFSGIVIADWAVPYEDENGYVIQYTDSTEFIPWAQNDDCIKTIGKDQAICFNEEVENFKIKYSITSVLTKPLPPPFLANQVVPIVVVSSESGTGLLSDSGAVISDPFFNEEPVSLVESQEGNIFVQSFFGLLLIFVIVFFVLIWWKRE
jgi:hypothetical protein